MVTFDKCYESLMNFHLPSECYGILISKILGLCIIFFSTTLKLPQIRNMLKDKSSIKSLSELAIFYEIMNTHVTIMYNMHNSYAFSSYGESVMIEVQNFIILFLFFREVKGGLVRYISLLSLVVITVLGFAGIIPEQGWIFIASSATVFLILSRLSSIVTSFKNKNTGPLSMITYILSIGGNIARIFTTVNENGDMILIGTYILALLLNMTVLLQILAYKKPDTDKKIK